MIEKDDLADAGKTPQRPTWQKPTLTDLSITSTQGGTRSSTFDDPTGFVSDYKAFTAS